MTQKPSTCEQQAAMSRARVAKNDEFYTRYEDVERICTAFKHHLKGKRVYCNCDTEQSAFVRYLTLHADELEITSLDYSFISYDDPDNLAKLDACDVVITNPPFSLYRNYLQTLIEHGKDFILVAPQTLWTVNIWGQLFSEGKIYPTRISMNEFVRPDGSIARVCTWITTSFADMDLYEDIPIQEKKRTDLLGREYDNYDAIECPRMCDLDILDPARVIGVPITFYNHPRRPEYDVFGMVKDAEVDGNRVFKRLFVKRKEQ